MQEQIISRIKKLLKHAESAKQLGSLSEAESFAQKATELLLEHNLEMSQINMSEDSDQFEKWIYGESISYKDNQSGQRWRYNLINTLTSHNLCNFTFNTYMKTFRVYGRMENVDIVVWMYNFLSTAMLRIAQESHVKLNEETRRYYNRYAFLKDFLLGAVQGLNDKLEEQRRSQSQNITSMILVNKDALEKYITKEVPNLKEARKRKVVIVGEAYNDGYEVGKNMSINKPLQSKETSKSKQIN